MSNAAHLPWPETFVFWGAGATAQLGMPPTAQLGNVVKELLSTSDLEKTIAGENCLRSYQKSLTNFLKTVQKPLQDLHDANDFALRQIYDFEALRLVSQKLDAAEGYEFLTGLYNLIDYGIHTPSGIIIPKDDGGVEVLLAERLRGARNLLDLFSILSLSGAYLDIAENSPSKLQPYINFAEILAELMSDEGVALNDLRCAYGLPESFLASRNFYLFSYAIGSLNYESVFLWLLFNAHKKANDFPSCIGKYNRGIKLFHDFATFFGIKKIGENKDVVDSVWYPYNEPVAQRLNSHNEGHSVARIGKFYYPHGNVNFRECPSCGKLNISFGSEWNYFSKSLFAEPPFGKEGGEQPCEFCGYKLKPHNNALIFQTSFKGGHAPFLEEIQRDMKVCVQNARHVVLLGYTLPADDLVWRTALTAKMNGEKYCSVVVGYRGPDKWLYGNELNSYISDHDNDSDRDCFGVAAIKNAIQVFGEDKVRAYTAGIPQVWADGKEAVLEMLYPKEFFKENILEERVKCCRY